MALKSISQRFLKTEEDDDEKQDISAADRQWVQQKCEEIKEWSDRVMIFWIKKIKKEDYKRQKRIVVITDYRLMSIQKANKKYDVRREGHLLDLVKVQEQGLILTICFKEFKLQFQCANDTDSIQILHTLYHNYAMTDPGFPPKLQCEWLDQYNTSQAQELSKKVPLRTNERGKWEKAVRSFHSYCSYYGSDAPKLSAALQSILSRDLFDKDDERWIRTSDMGITHSRVLAGLVISLTFTPITIDGIEIGEIKGDKYLYDSLTLMLRHNSSVKSLVLDGVACSPEWGELLHEGLNQNQRSALIRFGLRNAKIGEKGMSAFITGNKQLARQPPCIYLTKTGGSAKQMVQLIETFIGKSEYGSGLTELDLSDNPLESRGTQALTTRITTDFPDLKVLRLANCHVDIPRLLSAIEQAHKKNTVGLEELDISGNKCTAQDGLILSRIVANCGSMASLAISGCGFTGPVVAAVVAASLVNDQMKYYVQLEASDNDIGAEGAIMIASILRMTDRVMTLKLNNCDMGHEGMGYILKSLENQPYLRILELNNNCKREQWAVGKHPVADGLKALLEKASVLERLSIHNDPENGYQCDLDDFLVALRTNATLISLDISGNSLTNENLQALKEVVIKNEVLQELRWDNNGITSRHIVAMTHALKHNRSLQLVEFPDQDFEKELAQAAKDRALSMELQLIKQNFYKALFENKKLVGFEAAPLAMRRNMKKRHSLLPSEYKQREVQERKAPPSSQKGGGNQLIVPGNN